MLARRIYLTECECRDETLSTKIKLKIMKLKSTLHLSKIDLFRWLNFVDNLSNITHHNSRSSKNDSMCLGRG